MKQPLINVTRVDMKGIEKQLTRIANVLEMYFGIIPVGTEAIEDKANPAVQYASEDDLIRAEWAKAQGHLPAEDSDV